LNWKLEDSYGRAVLALTRRLADSGPLALMGGQYTLTVKGEGEATGEYEFELLDQGSATYTPSGDPVQVGTEVSGTVQTPGGDCSYTFAVLEGQRLFFDLIQGDSSLAWELLDPVGVQVFSMQARNTDAADAGPFTLAGGTYTLRFAAAGSATPSFTYKIWNVIDTEQNAELNTDTAGDFEGRPGSTAAFTFEALPGQRFYFEALQGQENLTWSLYDPAGRAVFEDIFVRTSDSGDQGPVTLAGGTYKLIFDPRYASQPSFSFRIRTVTDKTFTAVIGEHVQGAFENEGGGIHTYTFELSEPAKIFLADLEGSSGMRWSLYDPAGTPLFEGLNARNAEAKGPFPLGAGTHRLVLDPPYAYLYPCQLSLSLGLQEFSLLQGKNVSGFSESGLSVRIFSGAARSAA